MRNVTMKQLRTFAALVKAGSVTGAAQSLNITPPAVTLQMQLLQEQAGLPLIERTSAGMTPTDAGREVLAAAERVAAVLSECEAGLAELAGSQRGTASVGIVSTAKYFAPRALAAFARQHPEITLHLTVGNRSEIIAGLRQLDFDIAIMGRPPEELEVEATVIGENPHVIIAAPDHPLAGRRAIDPALLAGETMMVREPGSGTRSLMERFFADARVAPRRGMQMSSNETIKQAVMAGLGIAFISGHTIEAEIASGRLTMLDIVGLPVIRQWMIVHLRQRRLMPAVKTLCRFLIDHGETFLPVPRTGFQGIDRRFAEIDLPH
ncbi:LysR family transcriptional regulator [Labrys wisconsinensis]|uniref:HTH-type transcriptional regulator CbbR n=1 Tax=Labrys wisconsinensis TaxID=425677 RepID=A0ABU0J0I7_9HYPH|nr:LysR family transcriptional regulator [Labrys wisconsinensis]MDQ0467130.1 DNA-binding transcriptional LysR family regulator [Labrys wisconsinensis]